MYVCMYVCIMYMYVCMHVCMYVGLCVRTLNIAHFSNSQMLVEMQAWLTGKTERMITGKNLKVKRG